MKSENIKNFTYFAVNPVDAFPFRPDSRANRTGEKNIGCPRTSLFAKLRFSFKGNVWWSKRTLWSINNTRFLSNAGTELSSVIRMASKMRLTHFTEYLFQCHLIFYADKMALLIMTRSIHRIALNCVHHLHGKPSSPISTQKFWYRWTYTDKPENAR